ncbi:MAG: type II toxin-antitoxin system VapC family toxin [Rhizomicrobium sp.]
MILLDTCVVSESIRPKPDPAYLAWLKYQDPMSLFISVVTLGELHYGAAKSKVAAKQRELNLWITEVGQLFASRIVILDDIVARQWGYLRARYPHARTADAQLGATALAHDFTFATRNVKDFRFEGLDVVNPWES